MSGGGCVGDKIGKSEAMGWPHRARAVSEEAAVNSWMYRISFPKHLDVLDVGLGVLGVWHRPRSEGAATLSRSQPQVLCHIFILISCSPTCNDIFRSQLMVPSR